MENGIVLNIQRNQIHDGPGIRTIVFLKGCPLRCVWCSNPESQRVKSDLFFYRSKCTLCGKCIEVCRHNASKIVNGTMVIDREICSNCDSIKKCADTCPNSARQICGEEKSVNEIVREVEKDRPYYFISGGGVTIGGGEPFSQPEFTLNLLQRCRQKGFHTAIETTGHCRWPDLEKVLSYTDWIFYDLKLMDDLEHKKYTGISNNIILANARKLSEVIDSRQTHLTIRIPIIPGYTDAPGNIVGITRYVRDNVSAATEIEILSYHSYGLGKYEALGRKYNLSITKPLPEEKMLQIRDLIETYGIRCKYQQEHHKFNTTGAI